MAQRMITLLTDDLTGEEIKQGEGETITFSLDRSDYEIDLSKANADKLRGELSRFIEVARKSGGPGRRGRRGGAGAAARGPEQTRAIREWARQQGMDVSARGRIPAEVEKAYNQAH